MKSPRLLDCSPKTSPGVRAIYEPNLGGYVTSDFDIFTDCSRIRLDLTSAEDVAPPRSSFDVIQCAHVLGHLPDYRLALRKLCELLVPGGILIPQVPSLEAQCARVDWN